MEKDMRQVLNYPFWYSEDRIPVEACEQIIEMGKNLDIEEAGIYTPDSKEKGMDATYRKTNVAWFPDAHPVEQIIQSYVSLANIETGWNFTITNKEPVQFGEYKTRYFYNWHRDVTNTPGTVNRKLSVSVNLSNPLFAILFDKNGENKSRDVLFSELESLYLKREYLYKQSQITLFKISSLDTPCSSASL